MFQYPDILQFERQARRDSMERRAREREIHLTRLGMGGREDHNQQVPPPDGGGNDNGNGNNGNGGGVRRPQQAFRPIGAFDEPTTREVSLGIIPPPVASNDFMLKPSMVSMVERSSFKGSSIECPFEHLDRFERLCRTRKIDGVPDDTIRMMLFPFSLEDKGAYWERTIPSHLVSTWAKVKTEFLRKFFPKQKTVKIRNDIQGFEQKGNESLSETWDRLKRLIRSCPHHGLSKEYLLGIFYRGVFNENRRTLDIASFGSFASLDCEQAELLIENLAESDDCYGGDYDRTLRGESSGNDAKFEELSEKLDKLSKVLVVNKRQVAYMGSGQGDCQGAYQDFYHSNTQNHSQDLEIKTMLNLILEGQAKSQQEMVAINGKLVEMQAHINRVTSRIDCLKDQMTRVTTHVKILDSQVAQIDQVTSNVKSLNSQVSLLACSSQRTASTLRASYAIEPPSVYCGAIIQGEATIDLKDATKNASSQGVEAKPEVEAKVVKVRKGSKKKKLKKAQSDICESHPPSITLKPLKIIDGKLECKVECKGHSKPFTKARIILARDSTTNGDLGMVTPKMAVLFGLKLGDRGPLHDGSPPPTTI